MTFRIPKRLYSALTTWDGFWILGGAAVPGASEIKDLDIMVEHHYWFLASSLIPREARVNTLGGFKWEEEGLSIDMWPDELSRLVVRPKFKAAWHPKTDTRLVVFRDNLVA